MKRIHVGSLCLLIVLLAAPTAFARGDLIEKIDGKFVAGNIEGAKPMLEDYEKSMTIVLSEDFDFVFYNLTLPNGKKAKQKIKASQVREVHYYPRPPKWGEAVGAMNDGEYADAVNRFENLVKTKSTRFWMRLYGLWNIAKIHDADGQWQKVIAANDRLLKRFPRARVVPDAKIQTGVCCPERCFVSVVCVPELRRDEDMFPGQAAGTHRLADVGLVSVYRCSVDVAVPGFQRRQDGIAGGGAWWAAEHAKSECWNRDLGREVIRVCRHRDGLSLLLR